MTHDHTRGQHDEVTCCLLCCQVQLVNQACLGEDLGLGISLVVQVQPALMLERHLALGAPRAPRRLYPPVSEGTGDKHGPFAPAPT